MNLDEIKRIKIKNKISFKLIKRGGKWLEIRLARGFFGNVKVGTVIELYNGDESIQVIVESKHLCDSLEDLLSNRLIRIGSTPHIRNEEIGTYYRQFYSERALKQNKLVVLKIKKRI